MFLISSIYAYKAAFLNLLITYEKNCYLVIYFN